VTGRLRSIDILRAFAACSVVLFHSDPGFYLGAAGVDLFFVISGFVIASVSAGRAAADFLADRAARIFPLYWIALLPWILSAQANGSLDLAALPADILLLPRVLVDTKPLLLLSWTLVFELLFYCSAAASIRLGSPKPAMAVFAVTMLAALATGSPQLKWVGSPIILEFLFGVLIYHASKTPRVGTVALTAGLALLFTSPSIPRNALDFTAAFGRMVHWGVPSGLIVYGLLTLEHRLKGVVADRLCWLGAASYSIYLFHPLPLGLMHGAWWIRFVLGIAAGILGWALFERTIEKMRRNWRSRRKAGGSARPTAPVESHPSGAAASSGDDGRLRPQLPTPGALTCGQGSNF
jgi:exopolysaccharide production protein ExoZ